ncbi:hypothetical protein M9H77_23830 [Catharanthus roseus]|uniref:Uncharacterized protein n=1 Tax=Catharanthus roseus TaxID=4058 RepID=A0ACC0AVN2_CATRO|nr:hypothetical protein M9H77_23830 [Catharanthus roseus]
MNRDVQANEYIHVPITRARAKKMKAYDYSLAKGMVAFNEETLKNELKSKNEGFEDEGKPPKLLMMYTISKEYSMEQVGGPTAGRPYTYPLRVDPPPTMGPPPTVVDRLLERQSLKTKPTMDSRFYPTVTGSNNK